MPVRNQRQMDAQTTVEIFGSASPPICRNSHPVVATFKFLDESWSSLVEGEVGSHLPNREANLVIVSIVLKFHKHNILTLGQIQALVSC